MSTRQAVALAFALACLGVGAIGAAARQGQPAPAQQPSFRAGTTVVEVDVMVTDERGRLVEGLGLDDFDVQEDGVAQRVQTLYVVRGKDVTPLSAPATTTPAPSALLQRPPAAQRVLVVFFDLEHLSQGSFRRLQDATARFFDTQFEAGDVGGVLLGSTMVGNRLTTNKAELIAGVKDAKPSFGATIRRIDQRDWPRMSDVEAIRIAVSNDREVLSQVVDRAGREAAQGRQPVDYTPTVLEKARYMVSQLQPAAARTLKTLQALTTGLARIPGRKTVVFLSEGFMFENAWGDLRMLVAQAARADVRIYSVDALGLQRRDSSTDLSALQPFETGASIPTEVYNTVEEGPNTLALDTGGYVIRNTNDFTGALEEISRDTSHYYVLGYTPSNERLDGKFRQISVRVKRDGVGVRARRGYVAVAGGQAQPKAVVKPEPPAVPLDATPAAAPSPATAGDTRATPASDAAGAATVEPPVAAAVPIPSVALRPDLSTRVRELAERAPAGDPGGKTAADGWALYEKGDLEGAERYLDEAVGGAGAAPWVHYALGFTKLALDKPAEAARAWEHVRSAVPDFMPVYFDLADAYLRENDPGRSIAALRGAEERWPQSAEVLNALGTIQVKRGAVNDAIETFERAIALQPDDALAYFNAARTYELRYFQMRRFSRPGSRWVDNPADLQKALEYYGAYAGRGGPYEDDARAAIERLRSLK